jgi:thiol-disulfide isomerase/thioredoxin
VLVSRICAALLALLLLVACAAQPPAEPKTPVAVRLGSQVALIDEGDLPPQVGEMAPDFRFTVDGAQQSLAGLRGKVVLINFWATWCGPCALEMPDLNLIAQSDPNVVVLGINKQEGEAAVSAYAAERGIGFPLLLDGEAAIHKRYGAPFLPTTYFVDRQGRVAYQNIGPMTESFMRQMLAQIN